MPLLDRLERNLRPFAIPNLTLLLVIGQTAVLLASFSEPQVRQQIWLQPSLVRHGEWWRVFTFMILPPGDGILAIFGIYLFYLMGSALEAQWGIFRYNAYILIAYVATIALALFGPDQVATNAFIEGSVFLAFAYLFPDFEIYLFFILPVKMKYLALITWALYAWRFLFGSWMERLLTLAAVANYLLFFGHEIMLRARSGKRKMERGIKDMSKRNQPFHKCKTCGRTEKSNPELEFRVCPQCTGSPDYCMEHIRDHRHA